MQEMITGIQQVGIGVTDAQEAKYLYKDLFGMDVLIFDDRAEANLMACYTGNEVHRRRAILSMNMSGGGGFEIWQFTSRTPLCSSRTAQLGDLGIFAVRIKSKDVKAAHDYFSRRAGIQVSELMTAPDDRPHFWLTDRYANHFNVVEGDEWFRTNNGVCGGVVGVLIGVSNMDKALHFYRQVMGIDEVIYSGEAPMMDVPAGQTAGKHFRRVLLKKPVANKGAFSKLLGSIQIELIETKERVAERIYAGRYWGDCGFIHVCFDVLNMDGLRQFAENAGFRFSVDSADSFSMGSSAGRFCYMEDPDGTLIELVETHKVPIFKKWGLYLNLKGKKGEKPLPEWMIGMLALNKI